MLLLSEAFGSWAETTVCTRSTVATYARAIRHLIAHGFVFVDRISRPSVAAYLTALRARGLSDRTIANELAALLAVLGHLELEGRYPLERVLELRRLKPRERRRESGSARWLTRAEVERLAEAASIVAPRLELPVRIAALTGARVGELARMRREDFELGARPHVRIRHLPDLGERGAAKTGARVVPVCREVRALVLERCPRSGWLFPNSSRFSGRRRVSEFLSRWSLEYELQFARRAARLDDGVTFTVLRHTRASWWLQAGVSIYKVASWLGHQVRVCEAHYAGLAPYDPDVERLPSA